MMIKCSNIERKKEKNKMQGLKAKVYFRAFCFAGQDAIECVIGFRIDRRTIKRETRSSKWLSKCHKVN